MVQSYSKICASLQVFWYCDYSISRKPALYLASNVSCNFQENCFRKDSMTERNRKLNELIIAEEKAKNLFREIENRQLIQSGLTEKDIKQRVSDLAQELFGVKKYWHKRIVRAGKNTVLPYKHNPENLTLQEDDILFLDFGPVFEGWEADLGRTFVLGNNQKKLKLKTDIESAWHDGKIFYLENKENITGNQLYDYSTQLAKKYGWKFGNNHSGHLIGNFPHEKLQGEDIVNYIHPDNHTKMSNADKNNEDRFWIYEIHFIDDELQIGGFFEQLLD